METNHNHKLDSKIKKCSSCRLELPIYCFGLLRSASDGYNYTCRRCRNYRRRAFYNGKSEFDEISPLREHNILVLTELLKLPDSQKIRGIKHNRENTFTIAIARKPKIIELTVYDEISENTELFYFKTTTKLVFLTMASELLFRSEIRLLLNKIK